MTSGYVLILAILILGGIIATLGDRIGTKVGKARLSLFNLRPRRTATLVTIVTGSVISASTLGILLATSQQLRTGIFELDSIQRKLQASRGEIIALNQQKDATAQALQNSRKQQAEVQRTLGVTVQNLNQATQRRDRLAARLRQTRGDLGTVQDELSDVLAQGEELQGEITQIRQEQQELLQQRDQVRADLEQLRSGTADLREQLDDRDQQIGQRETQIRSQDTIIKERENRLQEVESRLKEREIYLQDLERAVVFLENSYRDLREGSVAIVRNQVLTAAVLQVKEPEAALRAVDQLLREANRQAIQITQPENTESPQQLVQITIPEVNQLANQIKDGREYLVRILAAGNYVVGEGEIRVFADVVPNLLVYQEGTSVATTNFDSAVLSEELTQQRLEQLLSVVELRSRRSGLAGAIEVEDGKLTTFLRFVSQLSQLGQDAEIRAIVLNATYTAGPLKLRLIAIKDGRVILSSQGI
jgi:uncharacterized protein (DUF3084 family)